MNRPVFDPLDPEFLADPFPGYAWLRGNDPVHHQATISPGCRRRG